MSEPKYFRATSGFSANGVSMQEGEYLTDQFDPQTVKVLLDMKRLEETDTPPESVDAEVTNTKGKNRAVGLPGGLPGAAGE